MAEQARQPGRRIPLVGPCVADEFPNNFVGDLVPTERGWVIVPPTACPAGHDHADAGWAVSSVRWGEPDHASG
jgi:hypothetical protein